ncbi:hypothetical protein FRZ61_02510 [Hypericibacter adhaerens]|uniref:Uncharacterized protein n=1 Tax=Hypericibacter adhaerens TaxID=2602016 RepID=A0A5J6MSI7_9PROT|nr:hypothetical protein FRZ61_02510 [Hypericibacter adhaerens]
MGMSALRSVWRRIGISAALPAGTDTYPEKDYGHAAAQPAGAGDRGTDARSEGGQPPKMFSPEKKESDRSVSRFDPIAESARNLTPGRNSWSGAALVARLRGSGR